MMPPTMRQLLLLASLLAPPTLAADSKTSTTSAAGCTATSLSGAFFDLRPDIAISSSKDGSKDTTSSRKHPKEDYTARGYDYGYNFTLNICDPVVKTPKDVVGVDEDEWENVAAYYEVKGKMYSLGSKSSVLTPRGTQLVLQYTGGSPCGSSSSSHAYDSSSPDFADWDEDDYILRKSTSSSSSSSTSTSTNSISTSSQTTISTSASTSKISHSRPTSTSSARPLLLKSSTFAFRCDRDLIAPHASVSFVSSTPDSCSYFFIVRTPHACAGAEPHKSGTVGPGSVFVIILGIAALVYVVGGVVYQRNVANARGWRQLPNYSLWAGIGGFISDIFIILTSSCARFLPGRRGYRTLSISPNGRGRSREDENRLIDQLDEEWDD